jgi:hypothetical protein
MVFLFYFNVQSQDKRKTDPTLTNNILYVWYCGSFCGCGFKKIDLKKSFLLWLVGLKYVFG